MAWILPWTPRHERHALIETARVKAGEARKKTEEAAAITRDLEDILQRNHFAQVIVDGLMGRGEGK